MNRLLWILSISLLFLSCFFDLISCPHSKVEESFQLQATHDLYYFGIRPAFQLQFSSLREYKDDNHNTTPDDTFDIPYDHLKYPGGKFILLK